MKLFRLIILSLFIAVIPVSAQKKQLSLPPTHADVPYGAHERNKLDLWIADSEKPAPLLICIHGGGFMGGDKSTYQKDPIWLASILADGISVAAINYRLTEDGKNPFPAPMLDGARAIQFLRYNAEKYNLDKNLFAATGGSAGAMMLMWIGFKDDMADPEAKDPVLRESTRLQVLAPNSGQSSVHIPTLIKWFGVTTLKEHPAFRPLFRLPMNEEIKMTPELEKAMKEASPITYLTKDDPPIYMGYGPNVQITETSQPGLWVHHPMMGIKLKEEMDKLKIECYVNIRREPPPTNKYESQDDFIVKYLKALQMSKEKKKKDTAPAPAP